jgi:hypothetical protein
MRVAHSHWLPSSEGSKWRAPREHNIAPLAAFIAQQFPTQNIFDRQALTLSRLKKIKALFFPVLPNSENISFLEGFQASQIFRSDISSMKMMSMSISEMIPVGKIKLLGD